MAEIKFVTKNDGVIEYEDVDNLTGPNAGFPYWMIKLTDKRIFVHMDDVRVGEVTGEEENIKKAGQVQSATDLAKTLGLET